MRIIMTVLVSLMFTDIAQAKADDDFAFICKSGVALQRGQELDGVVSEISTQFSYLVKIARTSVGDLRYQCFFKKKARSLFLGERKTITYKVEGSKLTLNGRYLGQKVTRIFEMVTAAEEESLDFEGSLRVQLHSSQRNSGIWPNLDKTLAPQNWRLSPAPQKYWDSERITVAVVGAVFLLALLMLVYKGQKVMREQWSNNKELRQWVFVVAIWAIAVPIYLMFIDYYGRRISDDELVFTVALMLVPSAVLALARYVYIKYIQ